MPSSLAMVRAPFLDVGGFSCLRRYVSTASCIFLCLRILCLRALTRSERALKGIMNAGKARQAQDHGVEKLHTVSGTINKDLVLVPLILPRSSSDIEKISS